VGSLRLVDGMMDQLRIWLTRIAAPLAFLAAATALVVVVQRALDEEDSSVTTEAAEPSESVPVTIETGKTEVPAGERQFYRIRAGDTLEAIATEFDTTVDELLELNPGIDSFALQPGTRIRVR
jgi:LysM repeat protein